MKIFNTMSRTKEEFIPQTEGKYKIYVCGPTVYNYIHIGNARPAVIFDTLRSYLKYRGNEVKCVSNITDIDDKIAAEAKELKAKAQEALEKTDIDDKIKDKVDEIKDEFKK